MFPRSLLLLTAFPLVSANDPAGSWLSYAVYNAPSSSSRITALNTTWTVPADPSQSFGSNAPGWWFGIQTAKGDGALIQPILAYGYQGAKWSIFNACFDWTDGSWRTSDEIYTVQPGDKITSSVVATSKRGYEMQICASGKCINTPYELEQGQTETESTAYFVLEHQPLFCSAYPADGSMQFENIYLEVDGQEVKNPAWEAKQEAPKCDSECKIVDPNTIQFSWTPKGDQAVAQPKPTEGQALLPAKWGFGGAPSWRD